MPPLSVPVFPFEDEPVKLLTIHQPWAWLIISGHKRYENRTWSTAYRGPLLIHAGKSLDSFPAAERLCRSLGITLPDEFAFGAILGTVEMTDCTTADSVVDDFASGPFCFHLANPVAFPSPIPWRGALGLIEPSIELITAVQKLSHQRHS
jgi:hypothetical protein